MVMFCEKASRNDEDTGAFGQEDGGGMQEGLMGTVEVVACEKNGDNAGMRASKRPSPRSGI